MSIVRTPEPFWKTTGPKAPWGYFDPDARLNFSFDLSPWVATAGLGLTVRSCEVAADSQLHIESRLTGDFVVLQIRAVDGQSLIPGSCLWFRLRMTLDDKQQDDRTFWLRVCER